MGAVGLAVAADAAVADRALAAIDEPAAAVRLVAAILVAGRHRRASAHVGGAASTARARGGAAAARDRAAAAVWNRSAVFALTRTVRRRATANIGVSRSGAGLRRTASAAIERAAAAVRNRSTVLAFGGAARFHTTAQVRRAGSAASFRRTTTSAVERIAAVVGNHAAVLALALAGHGDARRVAALVRPGSAAKSGRAAATIDRSAAAIRDFSAIGAGCCAGRRGTRALVVGTHGGPRARSAHDVVAAAILHFSAGRTELGAAR